jgi:hypothetical protein
MRLLADGVVASLFSVDDIGCTARFVAVAPSTYVYAARAQVRNWRDSADFVPCNKPLDISGVHRSCRHVAATAARDAVTVRRESWHPESCTGRWSSNTGTG